MEYKFNDIEKKWQAHWKATKAYQVSNISDKPKCYVLDMFPYPSGAGLHVGHPLGYIASDIYSRFKRLKGFNVLHPMGFDAFGLPAEQYAIDHGIHPAVSTEKNIANFIEQLNNIGFCYDWEREVRTCDPKYYKWTQWIFLQLFNSYYDRTLQKAMPIEALVAAFAKEGNQQHPIPNDKAVIDGLDGLVFSAADWNGFNEKTQQAILMEYRLAYCGYGEVNWCEALGTVLANDEVVNGVSERGGHPVVKKKLRQWYLRITEYAGRLQSDLDKLEWSEAMKEMQTNWIGKSSGAEISFAIDAHPNQQVRVYTTRPDTIFGVDFMVLAPDLEWIDTIVTIEQRSEVEAYIAYVKSRSERERMAEKKISGCFTGAYAINPFKGKKIPIWISEYVLAGYGTGAIMAVPCGDERDFKFARHYNIPITNILGEAFNGNEANPTKDAVLHNSDFLNGIHMRTAIEMVIEKVEAMGIGTRKTNYKMRDAAFSRQRYWGEPFPIVWKNGIAYPLTVNELPLTLPNVESYSPGPEGEGPLANIPEWTSRQLETNTMPGYAGSSWYFLRYMDPHNDNTFAARQATDYWNQVDVYVGGTEHAVGHLLYSRMWTKVLFDLGYIGFDEPFKRLVNQGMIQGSSRFVYRINGTHTFVSHNLIDTDGLYQGKTVDKLHVDVNLVDGYTLDVKAFQQWRNGEYAHATFILEDGSTYNAAATNNAAYLCGSEVEKMSKSKFNTVNPNDLVAKYGADTFRMYEMFLGPIEQSKPWDTKGIEGVHRFLRKLWRLFFDEVKGVSIFTNEAPTPAALKILHKTIKKIEEDTERFSFNTAVAAFMVCVNELAEVQCKSKQVLEPLLVLLAPYAPHIAEELYHALGNTGSVLDAPYPIFDPQYVTETTKEYPVSINGKMRVTMTLPLDADQAAIEAEVLANDVVQKWLEGKPIKKFIYVKGKAVNVVV
ncbi:MAG: leucine--tRNA ligase [Chitinophagaceae bacterium]